MTRYVILCPHYHVTEFKTTTTAGGIRELFSPQIIQSANFLVRELAICELSSYLYWRRGGPTAKVSNITRDAPIISCFVDNQYRLITMEVLIDCRLHKLTIVTNSQQWQYLSQ